MLLEIMLVQNLQSCLDLRYEPTDADIQVRIKQSEFISGQSMSISGYCRLATGTPAHVLRAWLGIEAAGSKWKPVTGSLSSRNEAYMRWMNTCTAEYILVRLYPVHADMSNCSPSRHSRLLTDCTAEDLFSQSMDTTYLHTQDQTYSAEHHDAVMSGCSPSRPSRSITDYSAEDLFRHSMVNAHCVSPVCHLDQDCGVQLEARNRCGSQSPQKGGAETRAFSKTKSVLIWAEFQQCRPGPDASSCYSLQTRSGETKAT